MVTSYITQGFSFHLDSPAPAQNFIISLILVSFLLVLTFQVPAREYISVAVLMELSLLCRDTCFSSMTQGEQEHSALLVPMSYSHTANAGTCFLISYKVGKRPISMAAGYVIQTHGQPRGSPAFWGQLLATAHLSRALSTVFYAVLPRKAWSILRPRVKKALVYMSGRTAECWKGVDSGVIVSGLQLACATYFPCYLKGDTQPLCLQGPFEQG
jgi:hypothetical protein